MELPTATSSYYEGLMPSDYSENDYSKRYMEKLVPRYISCIQGMKDLIL